MNVSIVTATRYPEKADAAYRRPFSRGDGAEADSSEAGLQSLLPEEAQNRAGKLARASDGECETCANRKYQDGSDDAGVSYKNPTKIDPKAVASAVKSHEMEHVYREKFRAESEGRRILYQSVSLHNGICGECGKAYVSGGTTRTVSRGEQSPQAVASRFRVGLPEESSPAPLSRSA